MRLLLVDDEKQFIDSLAAVLKANRYTVECCYDGAEALDYLAMEKFDCLLVDIMMPKLDGYSLVEKIRGKGDKTPVIFLSAKSEVDDRVKGLDVGGDDYLPKPFSTKELLARLRALLRRKDGITEPSLVYEGLSLDPNSFVLKYGDKEEKLSAKEYQIMELFLRKPEKIYSVETILSEAWQLDSYSDISSVWVFVSNLRKKLTSIGSPFMIKATRGLGYRLEKKDVQ